MRSLEVWPKSHVLFCWFFGLIYIFTCIMPELVRESGAWGSKFYPFCDLCYFAIHLAFHSPELQIVSSQSHGWSFWAKPSWVAGKYIFYDVGCCFCPILAFFEQKVPKRWRRNGPIKKQMPYLDSPHSNTHMDNKPFGTWKPLHSHTCSFSNVTCKLWVGLPGEFISLISQIEGLLL